MKEEEGGVLALPCQHDRPEAALTHRSPSYSVLDASVVLESVLSAVLADGRPFTDNVAGQHDDARLPEHMVSVGRCKGGSLYVELALELDLVKEVLRVEAAALVQRTNLLDKIVIAPRGVVRKKHRHRNPLVSITVLEPGLLNSKRVASPVTSQPPLLLSDTTEIHCSDITDDISTDSVFSVDSHSGCATTCVGSSETSQEGVLNTYTTCSTTGEGHEVSSPPSASASTSARSTGGFWGVQRVLGAARAVCRWLCSWRRTCCEVVAVGGSILGVARDSTDTASSVRFRPWRLFVLLLNRGPNVMLTLWPSLPFLGSLRLPSMPTTTTGICSTAALLAFGLTPLLGGSGSLLAVASEAVSAALSCWTTASQSVSQLAANSSHMTSLIASCVALRAPSGVDVLAAADFGLTAAAFSHLLISPALRWRNGHGAHYQLHPSVPPSTQELGFLAKVMYDVELPEQVELAGRTLHILPRASDVRMAVYVSEELLDGSSGDGAGARVAVCHRGTWSPADLLDDLHLLTGCFRASARYREAATRSNALLAAWPAATFTHVGHSLGGSVAMALVQRMPAQVNAEAHAFNPGISLEGFASARATVHLIAGDVVGYGAPAHLGAQCHVYPPHAGVRYLPAFAHPHSVTNFW